MAEENKPKLTDVVGVKTIFLVGLGAGVAIIAIIGLFIMAGLFWGQRDQWGLAGGGDTNKNVVADKGPQPSAGAPEKARDIQIAPVTDKDWVFGSRDAKVFVVEYSDTECPYCKRHHPTLQQLVSAYNGKVAWVYRHFPLTSLHPKSPKEAEATECAGELAGNDGFWKYLNKLFDVTPSNNGLDPAQLPQIAQDVGLDRAKFETCLNSGKYTQKIQDAGNQAVAAGGTGTPYNVILSGDQKIPLSGAVPLSDLQALIDPLLK